MLISPFMVIASKCFSPTSIDLPTKLIRHSSHVCMMLLSDSPYSDQISTLLPTQKAIYMSRCATCVYHKCVVRAAEVN